MLRSRIEHPLTHGIIYPCGRQSSDSSDPCSHRSSECLTHEGSAESRGDKRSCKFLPCLERFCADIIFPLTCIIVVGPRILVHIEHSRRDCETRSLRVSVDVSPHLRVASVGRGDQSESQFGDCLSPGQFPDGLSIDSGQGKFHSIPRHNRIILEIHDNLIKSVSSFSQPTVLEIIVSVGVALPESLRQSDGVCVRAFPLGVHEIIIQDPSSFDLGR